MEKRSKEELLTAILEVTDAHGFNTNVMPGYLYSKVLYLLDDLEPLLTDKERAKIERHGVQRGIEFLAGRPDPRGIPDSCFALVDGSVVVINKDVAGYADLGLELDDEDAKEFVDSENRSKGISRAQVSAMLAGATSGWNFATAYASSYLEDGTEVSLVHRNVFKKKEFDEFGNEQITFEGIA